MLTPKGLETRRLRTTVLDNQDSIYLLSCFHQVLSKGQSYSQAQTLILFGINKPHMAYFHLTLFCFPLCTIQEHLTK